MVGGSAVTKAACSGGEAGSPACACMLPGWLGFRLTSQACPLLAGVGSTPGFVCVTLD